MPPGDLVLGLRLAVRGSIHALRRGRVLQTCWPLFLTSLTLTLLLQGGGLALALRFTRAGADRAWWAIAGWVAMRFLGMIAALVGGAILGLLLTSLFVPLLSERIYLTSLEALDPQQAEAMRALPGLPLSTELWHAVRRLARFLPRLAIALLLSFVPIAGVVLGPVAEAWVAARFLAWELLEPALSRRAVPYRNQVALLKSQRWLLAGFALPWVPALAIPLVGPFLFTIAQAAAPLLVREIDQRKMS